MNIGQVLEIHLGMAAKRLGVHVATPVFDGVENSDLEKIMAESGMKPTGKFKLSANLVAAVPIRTSGSFEIILNRKYARSSSESLFSLKASDLCLDLSSFLFLKIILKWLK